MWEFYNYRREVRCFCLTEGDHPALIPVPHWLSAYAFLAVQLVQKCRPNPAHLALSAYEKMVTEEGRQFTLITQVITVTMLHSFLPKACWQLLTPTFACGEERCIF